MCGPKRSIMNTQTNTKGNSFNADGGEAIISNGGEGVVTAADLPTSLLRPYFTLPRLFTYPLPVR